MGPGRPGLSGSQIYRMGAKARRMGGLEGEASLPIHTRLFAPSPAVVLERSTSSDPQSEASQDDEADRVGEWAFNAADEDESGGLDKEEFVVAMADSMFAGAGIEA